MIDVATENATKIYNRGKPDELVALDSVSVAVRAGELAVLKGPSGSGKTTLLCLLGCMTRPTSGKVLVGGENVSKLPERFLAEYHRRTFGFIFQQFNLIPELSIADNVMVPLYPTDMSFKEMSRRAWEALERVGLGSRLAAKPRHLSGGEQQRVAVARALVNDPQVVIADEPTAHLDAALTKSLLEHFERIREEGRTVIIATHDPLVCECAFVDRVIEVRGGRIAGDGTA